MIRHHTLYRHYDANNVLLYIGITSQICQRNAQHKRQAHWWSAISVIRLEHFNDRIALLDAERLAIQQENPLYNVMHAKKASAPEIASEPAIGPFDLAIIDHVEKLSVTYGAHSG